MSNIRIQINYTSGHKEVMIVKTFSFKKNNLGIEVEWELTDASKMRPLYFNVDAVESIWELL